MRSSIENEPPEKFKIWVEFDENADGNAIAHGAVTDTGHPAVFTATAVETFDLTRGESTDNWKSVPTTAGYGTLVSG